MPKRKQSNPSRSPLATKPLARRHLRSVVPQAEPVTAPASEEPTPQAILARLLSGADPTTRQEAFLLIRWQRLAKAQRLALAFEWGLPVEQKEDRQLARQAMGELGPIS